MYQRPLQSLYLSFFRKGRLQRGGEYLILCLKHSNRAIYTSRVLWSGSIMSSITVNDKNHPLGKCHLIAYPVTAVSTVWYLIANMFLVSLPQELSAIYIWPTRPLRKWGESYVSSSESPTVFSTKQITLSGDRMLLQHPALQHWFTLLEYMQKQMSMA